MAWPLRCPGESRLAQREGAASSGVGDLCFGQGSVSDPHGSSWSSRVATLDLASPSLKRSGSLSPAPTRFETRGCEAHRGTCGGLSEQLAPALAAGRLMKPFPCPKRGAGVSVPAPTASVAENAKQSLPVPTHLFPQPVPICIIPSRPRRKGRVKKRFGEHLGIQ